MDSGKQEVYALLINNLASQPTFLMFSRKIGFTMRLIIYSNQIQTKSQAHKQPQKNSCFLSLQNFLGLSFSKHERKQRMWGIFLALSFLTDV
jgi:hypothetical protein